MHELVKSKVMEILNKEQDPEKVISLLKADQKIVDLKLSDEDFTEVQTSVEFFKALHSAAEDAEKAKKAKEKEDALKKEELLKKSTSDPQLAEVVKQLATMTDEFKTANTANKEMADELRKQKDELSRRDIVKWLTINCPYLPTDTKKTADEILILQKTSTTAAQIMKDGLQRASAALENSDAFDSIGSDQDGQIGPAIPGSEFLREIKKQLQEVKKSGEKVDETQVIREIVNSGGRNNYLMYRNKVIQRAKLAGLSPEVLENLM